MSLYVDDVRHNFGRMVMCHMWATTVEELHEHAQALGLQRRWFQQPPKASWEHYDVSLGVKARAIAERGALLTDKYGPVEHTCRLKLLSEHEPVRMNAQRRLDQIQHNRQLFGYPADGIIRQETRP